MNFRADQLEQLTEEYSKVKEKYYQLLSQYTCLQFNNTGAYEYARHGFLRRIKTLQRCVQNIYTICPPDRVVKPSSDELDDIIINLQSFVFNIFGCIDNLAWIWVKEKQLKNKKGELLSGGYVGLMLEKKNQIVRESFSQDFQDYLNSAKGWYENLENIRHALAHRIPLYVPPFSLNDEEAEKYKDLETKKNVALIQRDFEKAKRLSKEQDDLGIFIPLMTHSLEENAPRVVFHPQVLADWNTIIEFSGMFLKEFGCLHNNGGV
jgi:hypothetical protein